jgi:hypothetical protein
MAWAPFPRAAQVRGIGDSASTDEEGTYAQTPYRLAATPLPRRFAPANAPDGHERADIHQKLRRRRRWADRGGHPQRRSAWTEAYPPSPPQRRSAAAPDAVGTSAEAQRLPEASPPSPPQRWSAAIPNAAHLRRPRDTPSMLSRLALMACPRVCRALSMVQTHNLPNPARTTITNYAVMSSIKCGISMLVVRDPIQRGRHHAVRSATRPFARGNV